MGKRGYGKGVRSDTAAAQTKQTRKKPLGLYYIHTRYYYYYTYGIKLRDGKKKLYIYMYILYNNKNHIGLGAYTRVTGGSGYIENGGQVVALSH